MEMEANLLVAAFAGLMGAIILTGLIYLLKWFGQDIDIPYLLGSRFVNIGNKPQVYTTGVILHLLIGAGWGVLYVILLTAMVVEPNWAAGILWGFGHGIFVGSLMGMLAEKHPQIGPDKPIADPGILGRKWGKQVPYWILALHIVFGVCTLSIYNSIVFG